MAEGRNFCAGEPYETGAGKEISAGPMAEMEGSATVTLPRGKKPMVCVEYPGLVQNVDKMLLTLGGEEGVSRVREVIYCCTAIVCWISAEHIHYLLYSYITGHVCAGSA